MATYKKRGHKPKTKAEERERAAHKSATAEVFSTLDETASKSEQWVARNQKYILGVIGVVAVCVVGYLAYNQFVKEPLNENASAELYYPQQYFNQAVNSTTEKDSLFRLALEGADGKYGLLDVIEEYKGTDAANLATYAAGMSYLNLQQYEEAIAYLEDYKPNDAVTGSLAIGGIGDAFMQLGQPADALGYYENAIKHDDNNFTAPRYLLKAGITCLEIGQTDKAMEYFQRIKDEYSDSAEAGTIDAYIGMAQKSN
ncbi:MAG: tetratricopeptide repeat protein [Eudoraea sp.]|nr:tetratricopeptide repeat protein [Eudoraea sp.]